MSKFSTLLRVTKEDRIGILKHFNITEDDLERDVETLKEWLRQSPHLPNPEQIDENRFKIILLMAKMSIEKSKTIAENYYVMRALEPQIFGILVPNCDWFTKVKNLCINCIIPDLTPEFDRITCVQVNDIEGKAEDAFMYHFMQFLTIEVRISHDFSISNIIICDFQSYSLKTFFKYSPVLIQKLSGMLNSLSLRIKACHIVNAGSFIDKVLMLTKPFVPIKFYNKIHVHSSIEELQKHVPKEYLPSNYGGYQKSTQELHDLWYKELSYCDNFFNNLLPLKANLDLMEKNNGGESVALHGLGQEGSFKKLVVD